MLKTTNYNLNKPELNDTVDINKINENMDILDIKVKEVENKTDNIKVPILSVNEKTGAVVLSANDIKMADGTTVEGKINTKADTFNISNSVINTSKTDIATAYAVSVAYGKADSAYALANTKQDKLTISSSVISTSTTNVANSYAVKQTMDKADSAYNLANNNYMHNRVALVDGSVLTDFSPVNGTIYIAGMSDKIQINGINSTVCKDFNHFYLLLTTYMDEAHIIVNSGNGIVVPTGQLIINRETKRNDTIIEFVCISGYYRPVGIIQ